MKEEEKVKTLFRGMFAKADRKLARQLQRAGKHEQARKIARLARRRSVRSQAP